MKKINKALEIVETLPKAKIFYAYKLVAYFEGSYDEFLLGHFSTFEAAQDFANLHFIFNGGQVRFEKCSQTSWRGNKKPLRCSEVLSFDDVRQLYIRHKKCARLGGKMYELESIGLDPTLKPEKHFRD